MENERKKIRQELYTRLQRIYDNYDFILGVISNAPHDDDRKKIIEYIDNGENVTTEYLLLLSLGLTRDRQRNEVKDSR